MQAVATETNQTPAAQPETNQTPAAQHATKADKIVDATQKHATVEITNSATTTGGSPALSTTGKKQTNTQGASI